MNGGRQQASSIAGFIVVTAVGLGAAAPFAVAQVRPRDSTAIQPPPFATTVQPAPFATTVRPDARRTRARSNAPAVQETAPGAQDQDPNQDPNAEPTADDAEQVARRPQIGRPPVVDGNPNWPPQPEQPVDGVLETPEPLPAPDGVDPAQLDTRDPAEYQPFELPIENRDVVADPFNLVIEMEPILDRRPARLARFEPFDPVGVRVGSFTVFPELEMSVPWQSNVFRSSSNVRNDISFDVRPTVRAVSNWRTHAVEFRATGLSTFHRELNSEDDRAYTLETRARIDISRLTNVEAAVSRDVSQETRGSVNATSRFGDRADIETTRAGLTLNHRFNRLSIQLRGTMTDTDYGAAADANNLLVTNDLRDTSVKEVAARASWSFKPTLALFTEAAFNTVEYKAAASDAIERDSTGERYRLGVSFGNTSQILRGEASIGHGRQTFEDLRLPEISGVIIDANLGWRISGLTSLLLTAKTDVGELSLAGSGGALSRTAQAELRHAFQRRLIGTAALRVTRQDYEGVDLSEREVAGIIGAEYFLNREVTLFGRYQHVEFDSTEVSRNYNADEIRVGVRVRR